MGSSFLLAIGLVLVIEGILPFLFPTLWREVFQKMTQLSDGQLRFMGLTAMLIGVLVVALAQS